MTNKEHFENNVLEYFNIKEYFENGFKGKGIVVASVEGTGADSHGEDVKNTVLTYAPECTFISYNDTHEISATASYDGFVNFPNFVKWCIDNKVDIVTSSLDWTCTDYREIKAIKELYDAGIIFCNCAGNNLRLITRDDINKTWDFDKEVITVGGVMFNINRRLSWSLFSKKGSNYGSAVDVCGIGNNTPTYDLIHQTWYNWTGTSAATPMVAGMLATYKSFNHKLDSKTVWNIIDKLTKTIDYKGYTHKILTLPKMEEEIIMEEKDWKEEFEEVWDRATKLKVVDGTRKDDPITRNELVVILDRLGLLK